jgi:hypothetical protein
MSAPGQAHPDAARTVEAVIRHRLATALGGWRGSVETALPTVLFVVVWTWRQDVKQAVIAAVAAAAALAVLRVLQRSSLTHVFAALVATGFAAFFALRSGRAEDAFLPGILVAAAYLAGSLFSILTRWPVIGFVVGTGDPQFAQDPFRWRRDTGMVRVCSRLTWVLVALFAVRLAVMVPLYLAEQIAALGVTKILLGWPLWVAALAVMGWLLVSGHTPLESEEREVTGPRPPSPRDAADPLG